MVINILAFKGIPLNPEKNPNPSHSLLLSLLPSPSLLSSCCYKTHICYQLSADLAKTDKICLNGIVRDCSTE